MPVTAPVTASTSNQSAVTTKPPRPVGSLDRRRHNGHTNRQERDSKSRSTHSLKEKSFNDNPQPNSSQQYDYRHDPSYQYNRGVSPGFWEPPPPPAIPPYPSYYDHYYWNNMVRSREELRMMDHHRRQQQDSYRYGSNGALSNHSQMDLYNNTNGGGSGGNNGYYNSRHQMPPCCSYDHRNNSGGNQVRFGEF